MSKVTIKSTITHFTGHPRETIREAFADDPNVRVLWDGREVVGLCKECNAILVEGEAPCVHYPEPIVVERTGIGRAVDE